MVIALAVAIAVVLAARPRTRWLLPAVAPVLVVSVLASTGTGSSERLALLAGIGLGCAVLLAAGIDVNRGLARGIEWVGRALATAAAWFVFVVFLMPAWAWTRLRRHDPVRPGPRRTRTTSTWVDHHGTADRPTSLGTPPDEIRDRRSLTGRIAWAAGVIVLLLGANYAIGWGWDRAVDSGTVPDALARRTGLDQTTTYDPRVDGAAMAAYPWRERYFADLQRPQYGYWPFTESRPKDFQSPHINMEGWLRRSYQPESSGDPMPTVWMFGGSTTWGEGQRDDYTIASWLSRLAERDGIPIEMSNFGQRGWTHFQEMVLYAQRLELEDPPDLAIFYDGANEVNAQSLLNEGVPTHTLAYQYAQKLVGSGIATELVQQAPPPDLRADAWHAYTQHSAIHKVAAWLRPQAVGAAPLQAGPSTTAPPDPAGEFTPNQEINEDGYTSNYRISDEDGTDAGRVYELGKDLTLSLSRRFDVEPLLFWQPMAFNEGPYRKAREQLTDPTIDIGAMLEDHRDVFIDGGHTNEEGARLVAVEIWKHLRPKVQAWYRENR